MLTSRPADGEAAGERREGRQERMRHGLTAARGPAGTRAAPAVGVATANDAASCAAAPRARPRTPSKKEVIYNCPISLLRMRQVPGQRLW